MKYNNEIDRKLKEEIEIVLHGIELMINSGVIEELKNINWTTEDAVRIIKKDIKMIKRVVNNLKTKQNENQHNISKTRS